MFKRILYRNYRRSSSVMFRLWRRLTPAGLMVLGGMFVCGSLGVDTNLAMAYQAFAFFAALLLVAMVSRVRRMPKLSARRTLPRYGSVGVPLTYAVSLLNETKRLQRGLSVSEKLSDPRPTLLQFVNTPEPGEEKRNLFDRTFVYYRWQWLTELNRMADATEARVPTIPPGAEVEVRMELMPRRRGVLRLDGVTIAATDPLGLLRRFKQIPLPQHVLVLPKRYLISSVALPGTRQYQQGGVALAASVGESEEFVSLREYRRGDPLRHIHWKSSARTGRLVVKEFQDEYFVRHALILDTFQNGLPPDVFEEAVSIAASFACTVQTQDSLLDLMFVGPEAYCFTSGRGVGHTQQILEILASVQPCHEQPFDSLERLVGEHMNAVSGCICVFLDWDETRRDLVERIKVYGVPLLVIVVRAADAAPLEPGPMRDQPGAFHCIEVGRVEEALLRL